MSWFTKKRIYLDYASATPVLPEVISVMDRYWSKDFYNPSAIYREGLKVKEEVRQERTRLVRALGVSHDGVVFTSGGTEANNLAILGVFESWCDEIPQFAKGKRPHIIISAIEHSSIIATAKEVERRGGEVSILDVNEFGEISLEDLESLLRPSTFIVSIGLANGEIGTIQPLSKIGRILREYRKKNSHVYPYLHTDASQAVNFLEVGVESLLCDLVTLDASKIYGPKGVGALVMRRGVNIHPTIFGGKQEGGRRAGTLNTGLIAGFVRAFEVVQSDRVKEGARLESFRKYFFDEITRRLPQAKINGSRNNHLPNIISVSLPGTISEFVLLKLEREGVLVSVGSACSYDEKISGSYVVSALGQASLSESTLRFSFGRMTTKEEVIKATEIFCQISKSVLKYP